MDIEFLSFYVLKRVQTFHSPLHCINGFFKLSVSWILSCFSVFYIQSSICCFCRWIFLFFHNLTAINHFNQSPPSISSTSYFSSTCIST
jgi:hypothetical protein